MAPSKVIVVLGATGQQGGSVVDIFLKDASTWNVRAITRDQSSVKARNLADRGVEVVEADMSQPSSLCAAFQDATVIFTVSDFLGTYFSPENRDKPGLGQSLNAWVAQEEARQLKNVIRAAAKLTTLERLVFSSLSNVTKWSKGKYTHVYHFDGKASAEEYGRLQHPKLWAKTSVLQAGIFLNTLNKPAFQPRMSANGAMTFVCPWNPDLRFPWLVPDEDTGPLVWALVHDDPGKSLLGYREFASTREIASMFGVVSGLKTEVSRASDEQFWANAFSPGLVTEFTEHLKYWEEFGFEAQESPKIVHPSSLSIPSQLPGISDWLQKQSWKFAGQDKTGNTSEGIKPAWLQQYA